MACEVEDGVGTRLAEIIPDWAVSVKEGCGCKDYECIMNSWGPEKCRQQTTLIVTHLMTQSAMLIPMFQTLPPVAKKLMAKALVNRAISLEEKRLASNLEGDA